jgi:ABC-type uncharacterized transport system permease subunit
MNEEAVSRRLFWNSLWVPTIGQKRRHYSARYLEMHLVKASYPIRSWSNPIRHLFYYICPGSLYLLVKSLLAVIGQLWDYSWIFIEALVNRACFLGPLGTIPGSLFWLIR